jgi:hypothetical protein
VIVLFEHRLRAISTGRPNTSRFIEHHARRSAGGSRSEHGGDGPTKTCAHPAVRYAGNTSSRAHPARGRRKLPPAANPRNAGVGKACSRRESPPIPLSAEAPRPACHAGGRGFESRRSRRKHPANWPLFLPDQAQTTAGFPPVSRTDSARGISRDPLAKSAANGRFLSPVWALGEPPAPRSSRADPARA